MAIWLTAVMLLTALPEDDQAVTTACGRRSPCELLGVDEGPIYRVLHLSVGEPSSPTRAAPEEYWLAAPSDGGFELERIVDISNDGNGASGVGEDHVSFSDGTFTHEGSGGSTWRWNFTRVTRLRPLQIISERTYDGWNPGPQFMQRDIDFDSLRERVEWYLPKSCDADDAQENHFGWVAIPDVEIEPAFADGGWQHLGYDACSVSVDGSAGFTVAGAGDDASFRALVSEGTLYVDIADDVFRSGSARWVFDDHLELWLSTFKVDIYNRCLEASPPSKLVQLGVRLGDGKIFSGFGSPATSMLGKVEKAKTKLGVRLKIGLPPDFSMLSVVYSDSDEARLRPPRNAG